MQVNKVKQIEAEAPAPLAIIFIIGFEPIIL